MQLKTTCYGWTVTSITLQQLSELLRTWNAFVVKGVFDIQEKLLRISWDRISTTEIPADIALRGFLQRQFWEIFFS